MSSEPSHTTLEQAATIVAACSIPNATVSYLASGATSEVWQVRAGDGHYALRIAIPNPWEPCSYEPEFAIRQQLTAIGGRVARPVATNSDVNTGAGAEWSLDEYVAGGDAERAIDATVARDLGEVLARLHEIPVEGFGLLRNQRAPLCGVTSTARAGIMSRLQQPWPFSGDTLDDHPIASAAPELLGPLRSLEVRLWGVVEPVGWAVINHTDLHRGQLALANGRLAALLDFGDAAAGPRCWDIASFAYFNGWELTRALLAGYTHDATTQRELEADAKAFGVILALHHAGRAGPLNQPGRLDGALRYLRERLPDLSDAAT